MATKPTTPTGHEWHRARREPTTYACDRYHWLRPADPRNIAVLASDTPQLIHVTQDRNGDQRTALPASTKPKPSSTSNTQSTTSTHSTDSNAPPSASTSTHTTSS